MMGMIMGRAERRACPAEGKGESNCQCFPLWGRLMLDGKDSQMRPESNICDNYLWRQETANFGRIVIIRSFLIICGTNLWKTLLLTAMMSQMCCCLLACLSTWWPRGQITFPRAQTLLEVGSHEGSYFPPPRHGAQICSLSVFCMFWMSRGVLRIGPNMLNRNDKHQQVASWNTNLPFPTLGTPAPEH